jgi:hypothetical protein
MANDLFNDVILGEVDERGSPEESGVLFLRGLISSSTLLFSFCLRGCVHFGSLLGFAQSISLGPFTVDRHWIRHGLKQLGSGLTKLKGWWDPFACGLNPFGHLGKRILLKHYRKIERYSACEASTLIMSTGDEFCSMSISDYALKIIIHWVAACRSLKPAWEHQAA